MGIVIITRLDVELFLFYIPPPSWSSPLLLCVHTSMALAKYMRRRLSILFSQAKTPKKAESSRHSKSIIESSSSSFWKYKNLTCNIWGSAKEKPIKTKRETAVKCQMSDTVSTRLPCAYVYSWNWYLHIYKWQLSVWRNTRSAAPDDVAGYFKTREELSLFCLFLLCWTFLTSPNDAPPSHKFVGWK